MKEIIIFGIVNFIATVLGGASGGAGGLMIAPLMVLLGLNPVTAIATAKFSGFGINLGANIRFWREKVLLDRKSAYIFMLIGLVSSVIGSLLLVKFSSYEDIIQKMMGYVILFIGLPLLYARNLGIEPKIRSKNMKSIGYILLFFASILASAIGSGAAAVHMIILMSFFGMTALRANIAKRSMQMIVTTVSLLIFIAVGFVDYRFGIVALITSLLGGYIGAHIAIKKGNKFIVNLFAIMAVIFGFSLIFRE